ncbi:MAG TPA: pilin [Candidatus Andersenbacteria bacterium]|nr:pilin [Candidatus Andersenbacteria bacterium]
MHNKNFKFLIPVLFLSVCMLLAAHQVAADGITNPLGNPDQTISDVLTNIIKWMLGLVGFLALIALIIGGGRMIMDFGNEEQVHKAKTTILWAVIGLLVVILSYAIVNIVTTEVLHTSGGSGTQNQPGS